jgi:hypothetical protein
VFILVLFKFSIYILEILDEVLTTVKMLIFFCVIKPSTFVGRIPMFRRKMVDLSSAQNSIIETSFFAMPQSNTFQISYDFPQ